MKRADVFALVLLAASALLCIAMGCNGCTDNDDDDSGDDDSGSGPDIQDVSNSGCKEDETDAEPAEGIDLSYADGFLTVVHTDVVYNCCLDRIDVTMQIEGTVISLYETEVAPNPCDCICRYDVTTRISGLESGTYTVNIYVNNQISVSGTIEIP